MPLLPIVKMSEAGICRGAFQNALHIRHYRVEYVVNIFLMQLKEASMPALVMANTHHGYSL
jgi:hypothetical protein